MGVGHFLRLKGRTSYFRRKVPENLRRRLVQGEVCVSLGVIDRSAAGCAARFLAVAVDRFFSDARKDNALNAVDLNRVCSVALRTWREEHERDVAARMLWRTKVRCDPREDVRDLVDLADTLIAQYDDGESVHEDHFVEDRCARAGVRAPSGAIELHQTGRALTLTLATRFLGEAIEIADRRELGRGLRGLPVARWRERHERLLGQIGYTTDALARPSSPTVVPEREVSAKISRQDPEKSLETLRPKTLPAASAGPKNPIAGPLFSAAMKTSLDRRIAAKVLVDTARHEAQATTRIWIEEIGDLPIASYKREDVSNFQQVLLSLPKHYWRSEKEKRKNIKQIIKEANSKDRHYERVSNVTVNKHMSRIASFFDWCVRHGKLTKQSERFWADFALPTGASVTGLAANEERLGWPNHLLEKLFQHPIYTGRKSEYFYNAPGNVIIRDALYWTPIIAGLHGMRREEFAQLRVKHVRQIEDIWCFDLYDKTLKVKTFSSPRYVPLHKDLLSLRFIEEMVEGRQLDERLFIELSKSEVHDAFGDAVGKRVARVMQDLEMVVKRKDGSKSDGVFHPFRHRLVTMLTNCEVQEAVIDSITGHSSRARGTERSRYTDRIDIGVLKAAIDRMTLPLDTSALNEAWDRLKANTE